MSTIYTKQPMEKRSESAVLLSADGKLLTGLLVLLTMMAMMIFASGASAQDERQSLNLDLKRAMQLALEKNFDIQIKALENEQSYSTLLGSLGVYNFTFEQTGNYNARNSRRVSTFAASESRAQSISSKLSRKIYTGGTLSSELSFQRRTTDSITSTLNPAYDDTWRLSITQPLLKNFGKSITERQILVNRNNLKISDVAFEAQVIATLIDVQKRYWQLVTVYDAYRVAEDSLELAMEQLEINKIKVEVGTLPEIEIIQAEQTVAQREAELVDAEGSIRRAEDNLKQAIVVDNWDLHIIPADGFAVPSVIDRNFAQSYKIALDKRYELRTLDLQIQNNDIQIKYSKNQLKPSLNLSANVDLYSSGGNFVVGLFGQAPPEGMPLGFTETFRDVFSGTNRTWNVGATFSYILDNNAAKANIMSNEVRKRQNNLRVEQTRYTIAVDVRNAIRELEISAASLEARKKALAYSERQLEAERQKFAVGTSTNFQVLDFQNKLATSRYQVILSQKRYTEALIDYERATGMLLENNQVRINTTAEGIAGAAMDK